MCFVSIGYVIVICTKLKMKNEQYLELVLQELVCMLYIKNEMCLPLHLTKGNHPTGIPHVVTVLSQQAFKYFYKTKLCSDIYKWILLFIIWIPFIQHSNPK